VHDLGRYRAIIGQPPRIRNGSQILNCQDFSRNKRARNEQPQIRQSVARLQQYLYTTMDLVVENSRTFDPRGRSTLGQPVIHTIHRLGRFFGLFLQSEHKKRERNTHFAFLLLLQKLKKEKSKALEGLGYFLDEFLLVFSFFFRFRFVFLFLFLFYLVFFVVSSG